MPIEKKEMGELFTQARNAGDVEITMPAADLVAFGQLLKAIQQIQAGPEFDDAMKMIFERSVSVVTQQGIDITHRTTKQIVAKVAEMGLPPQTLSVPLIHFLAMVGALGVFDRVIRTLDPLIVTAWDTVLTIARREFDRLRDEIKDPSRVIPNMSPAKA